jgi:urease accessory protein
VKAVARLVAEPDDTGGTRLCELRSEAPLALRPTPAGVFLVGSAAGPVGGDELELDVVVGRGASLTIRSAAATLALPGRDEVPSSMVVRADVDGSLRWLVEPVVAVTGCRHSAEVELRVGDGGVVLWRDEFVLGRHGEAPGRLVARLRCDVGGVPLLRHELYVGDPGWDGAAVLGDARVVGSLLLAGGDASARRRPDPGPGTAVLDLDGPGVLVTALGTSARSVRADLDAARAQFDELAGDAHR